MRPIVLVLAVAACSGGGDGAVLTFDVPEGPAGAGRIELVLASSSEESMTTTRQRTRPGMPTEEDVIYYRQRSPVDAIVGITSLDGFEVRIEPDETLVPDETFIPFALIYDEQDVLIGVGSVNDPDGVPSAVLIKPGIALTYTVTVTALAATLDDDAGLAVGQGHAVDCKTNEQAWRSGAVWKGASGPQIRLLLPDLGTDPAATDAMSRTTDLDCDLYPADHRDCDDLRTTYNVGQTETCDGNDTDCDGRRLELVEGCPIANNLLCSTGVQACFEAPGATGVSGQCVPTAACGCQQGAGTTPPNCNVCTLSWVPGPGGADPCDPSVGKLHFEECPDPGCTIELVDSDGPWELKIGPEIDGPFSSKLIGVTTNYYFLRARYLGNAPFAPTAPSIGAAYVAIHDPAAPRPRIMPINLELELQERSVCTSGSGNNSMYCRP